jgi:4-hydroxybenzoate polyprenyltransferase
VSIGLVPIAGLMILLGIAYSFPAAGLKAKGMPVVSSVLHFAGTVLTYLLGSAAFAPIDYPAVVLGCYFGILITAGHLVQEVQDYADDRLAGVRTNAVQFGQANTFWLSFGLFGLSFVLLVWLSVIGMLPAVSGYTVVLFPIYAYWAIQVIRAGLPSNRVRQLRNRYRLLFAVVALVLLIGAVAEKIG